MVTVWTLLTVCLGLAQGAAVLDFADLGRQALYIKTIYLRINFGKGATVNDVNKCLKHI